MARKSFTSKTMAANGGHNMKVYIKYKMNGFGPYSKLFECQAEAMDFIKSNQLEITAIDFCEVM